MSKTEDRLFIYGTLLKTAGHPLGTFLGEHGKSIGAGSIQARLYVITETDAEGLNRFPAAIPSANSQDRVFGEVMQIADPDTVFAVLDDYEGCSPRWPEPYEFLLRQVAVRMDDGTEISAKSYLYTWDISQAEPVPSGRFGEAMPTAR